MRSRFLLSLLFCATIAFAPAKEVAGRSLEFKVPADTTNPSDAFPDIQAEAKRLDKLIRNSLLVPARPTNAGPRSEGNETQFPTTEIKAFARTVSSVVTERLVNGRYEAMPLQLKYFEDTLAQASDVRDPLPELSVRRDPNAAESTYLYEFTDNPGNPGLIPRTENTDLTVTFTYEGKPRTVTHGRIAMLQSLDEAIRPYQRNAGAIIAHDAQVKLALLADEWDAYFEKGRPQTFWDIALTTWFERKHFKADHLVGPPPRQWFVLHPNVVVENLEAASDGDQLGGAVAIEWIGVNFWKLKVPLGISLSSLYSDRPGVDDVGHGVTVYVANRYCIGWASHGGDNGFFASVDLLKFVESKKSKLEGYRSRIDKLVNP